MTPRQSRHLKGRFLEHFRETGNVTVSCRAVGVKNRTSVYVWLEHDEEFAIKYREAEIEATEVMEAEARRRAVEGVETVTPIMHRGQVVSTIHDIKYSDTLLIFLLKARAPEKYRETINLNVNVKQQAEKIAAELGLDPAEVIAEAERLMLGSGKAA